MPLLHSHDSLSLTPSLPHLRHQDVLYHTDLSVLSVDLLGGKAPASDEFPALLLDQLRHAVERLIHNAAAPVLLVTAGVEDLVRELERLEVVNKLLELLLGGLLVLELNETAQASETRMAGGDL